LGAVFLFAGILLYRTVLHNSETRSLIKWAIITEVVCGIFSLLFVLRINLKMHIPDFPFVIFTTAVTTTLLKALILLPPLVIIAKMIPKNVEGTMFAFATTIT